jgi:hypothetical protein
MEHARQEGRSDIALLLDQEKAYDRVHPLYLKSVLVAFGFSRQMVDCIIGLFFDNRVRININGHFTDTVIQRRGLRQGDPLSPVLFNMVLEPLLRHILQDQSFQGFVFSNSADMAPLPALKVIAYADDVCVFLSSHTDFHKIQEHLNTYGRMSNAKVNIGKTEAISLSGRPSDSWQELLIRNDIRQWLDRTSPQSLRYLGYPVISSITQRRYVEAQLIMKIQQQCGLYAQRHLSLRGKVTVANTLILSQLWYILRLVSFPKAFFSKIRSLIYQFVCRGIKPGLRYATLCQPLDQGGLGLLDPLIQQRCLQYRWIRQLMGANRIQAYSQPYLQNCVRFFHSSGTCSLLSLFFPALRSPAQSHLGFFLEALYEAFDCFPKEWMARIQCNATTALNIPVREFFKDIPHDHWLLSRHRNRSLASQFFTYDDAQYRVRPLLPPDSPRHPKLSEQLLVDLNDRRITLTQLAYLIFSM